jgi:hypothetical protein
VPQLALEVLAGSWVWQSATQCVKQPVAHDTDAGDIMLGPETLVRKLIRVLDFCVYHDSKSGLTGEVVRSDSAASTVHTCERVCTLTAGAVAAVAAAAGAAAGAACRGV